MDRTAARTAKIAGSLNCITVVLAAGFLIAGCSPKERVRIDLDRYLKNPDAYIHHRVTLTAPLADVIERYDLYRNRQLEISAPVSFWGRKQYWTWYLTLAEGCTTLRCYTHYYRLRADRFAIILLEQAKREKGDVTVIGKLRRDGLELEKIIYDNQVIRTDMKPPSVYLYGGNGWWGYR